MRVELAHERFFASEGIPDIEPILARCLSDSMDLHVALTPGGVSVTTLRPESVGGGAIVVGGRWRSNLLDGSYQHPGALLLAPFLFTFREMRLPFRALYTQGRKTRSVADVCMRNYLFAAIRGEPIQFRSDDETGALTRTSAQLAKIYLWMTKEYLKEDLLSRPNAIELILANAHMPLLAFSNPLLNGGVSAFQAAAANAHAAVDLKVAFYQTRQRVMALYEA